jgi:selenocysteine lyase/cysteine desulfurase
MDGVERGCYDIVSPTDEVHGTGIWCVRPPDVDGTFARLRAAGVVASLREGSIRLSPHVYNTVDEVVRVVDLLSAR